MNTKTAAHCLNVPVGLSPSDQNILSELPADFKVGIIVGAGDGRLVRAVKEKLGSGAKVICVEPRPQLKDLLADLGEVGADPWNFSWYDKFAKANGGLDFIIFSNIHEYWTGKLNTMHKIVQLLKPSGLAWLSFYNSTTLYEVGRHLPPLETGYERLGNPMELWAKMDISSWMIYLSKFDTGIHSVWGMLQDNAYEFCQKKTKDPEDWRVKDCVVKVSDIGDAFVLGAPIVCLKFSVGSTQDVRTQFFGVEYNSSMIQSVLFPYADILGDELDSFSTYAEIMAFQAEKEHPDSILIDFFLKQIDDVGEVNKVLVLGAGWGQDLLVLKNHKNQWDITGVERSFDKVAMGKSIVAEQGLQLIACNEQDKLPFADGTFDLVISLRHFSSIYYPFAKHLATEAMRVSKLGMALFEDSRGPELSMRLKAYPIPDLFQELGYKGEVFPLNLEETPTGLYILKVKK